MPIKSEGRFESTLMNYRRLPAKTRKDFCGSEHLGSLGTRQGGVRIGERVPLKSRTDCIAWTSAHSYTVQSSEPGLYHASSG
jgi:hypothetical protein